MSVDAIWEEMRQKDGVDLAKLQRKKPKVKKASHLDKSISWMSQWNVTLQAPKVEFDDQPLAVANPPLTHMDVVENVPTDSPDAFAQFLKRDINLLQENAWQVRLASLEKLYHVISDHNDELSADLLSVALDELMRPLIKKLKDSSEKCRAKAIDLLTVLLETAPDISITLGYCFPALVSRIGCQDIDGIAHVPEKMRPNPEQRPMEVRRFVEDSEEVRLQIAKAVQVLFARLSQQQVFNYVDEAVAILRALAMDPYSAVKSVAMAAMQTFCYNHKELLLHFTVPLGRSLTSCLVHNICKIRIESLQAITAVLHCGSWKTSHEVVQMMVAWSDPNIVPVKAFYEGVTQVNYMAFLTFDRHPAVRRFWFETITYWMLKLPDHCDHETHLFQYLLSGLYDENDEIALEAFWLLELLGEAYEIEHEKEIRDQKQYGFDLGWTYDGRARVPFPLQGKLQWDRTPARARGFTGPDLAGTKGKRALQDSDTPTLQETLGKVVPLPARDYAWPDLAECTVYEMLPRPRLGARLWVRSHIRRFIKALFNDVCDFRECTTLNAARLLAMCIAYAEEGITEWVQPLIHTLTKCFAGRAQASSNKEVLAAYELVCWQLGAFLDPVTYWQQLRPALEDAGQLGLESRLAQLHILAHILEGSIVTLQSVNIEGLGRLKGVLPEMVHAMCETDLIDDPAAKHALKKVLLAALPLLREVGNAEVVLCALAVSATDVDLKEGEFETERFDDVAFLRTIEEAMGIRLEQVLVSNWWENCGFQSIRAVTYLAPLERLGTLSFLDETKECLRLGVYLALKASKVGRQELVECALRPSAKALLGFTEGKAGNTQFSVAATCLQVLRRLCVESTFCPGPELLEIMKALIAVLVDGELHKRIQAQIDAHERLKLNKLPEEDFPILKLREIREDAIEKSHTLRCLAGDIFLILFRRYHQRAPHAWREAFFRRLFEVLDPSEAKVAPFFRRPTPPAITLLALEGILLCIHKSLPDVSELVEDAQRQVYSLKLPTQNLVTIEGGEKLAEQCVMCLMELNVQLPADPRGPLTPLCEEDDRVLLGHDFGLSKPVHLDDLDDTVPSTEGALGGNPMRETTRLLAQAEDNLKWNLALFLYKIGMMGAKLWPHHFLVAMQQWKHKNKEARYLIAEDIFRRIA
eukprot:GEMP01007715.1.p1 GENE.GEMP01007715.1~~GEMP01007715.1.p1  ORF type:complete len:1163 (+),score=247.38 GEMP01007715.1:34-3489(+)